MPHVLVAPDKFKGSLAADEAARALARGIRRVRPRTEVRCAPVADGGEGTLVAAEAAGFEPVIVQATGPTGLPVATRYARKGDTAVVEMADVSGLGRLPDDAPDPMHATSFGTGEVIAAAVAARCTHVVLGIGGSASTDGGAGMLQALGARLLDVTGEPIPSGGAGLSRLDSADLEGIPPFDLTVACDVDNPLTGPYGAARVYAPQKGASPDEATDLDAALAHWADIAATTTGRDPRDVPGAGAAGGMGFAALLLPGSRLRPGIEVMLELLDFEQQLTGASLVVVGEGSLDEQTLRGKAPAGVARAAKAAGARVVAVCGRRLVTDEDLRGAGIDAAYALLDIEPDPAVCMAEAAALLERLGDRVATEQLTG